jgi:hypothetical protein
MEQPSERENVLDLLEREDRDLEWIFSELDRNRGGSVEERAEYGTLAKKAIRHVATREAARVEVTRVINGVERLAPIAQRLERKSEVRRGHIDRVERMSRGIQGINLNTGQDFDGELRDLTAILQSEFNWELQAGVPAIRRALPGTEAANELKSARHVARHAPTRLDPHGPRWFERAPVISRIITVYQHLRDFPRAVRPR